MTTPTQPAEGLPEPEITQADRELLACPFCGNEVQDDEGCFQSGGFRFPATPVWSVRCGNPECNADVSAVYAEAAIAAWNRRATAAKDAEIEALRAEVRALRRQQSSWGRHVAAAGCEYVRNEEGDTLVNRRAERLAEALRNLLSRAPSGHECSDFHHSKDDRHGPFDVCPPMQRWPVALHDARAALNPTAAQDDEAASA